MSPAARRDRARQLSHLRLQVPSPRGARRCCCSSTTTRAPRVGGGKCPETRRALFGGLSELTGDINDEASRLSTPRASRWRRGRAPPPPPPPPVRRPGGAVDGRPVRTRAALRSSPRFDARARSDRRRPARVRSRGVSETTRRRSVTRSASADFSSPAPNGRGRRRSSARIAGGARGAPRRRGRTRTSRRGRRRSKRRGLREARRDVAGGAREPSRRVFSPRRRRAPRGASPADTKAQERASAWLCP